MARYNFERYLKLSVGGNISGAGALHFLVFPVGASAGNHRLALHRTRLPVARFGVVAHPATLPGAHKMFHNISIPRRRK